MAYEKEALAVLDGTVPFPLWLRSDGVTRAFLLRRGCSR
jgi:hypothetical protein